MNINKVIANGQTIVDLTDTTATADDVKIGKLFHDVSGALTSGTFEASGLEYEEGTFTPEEDFANQIIYFKTQHETKPFLLIINDMTDNAEYEIPSIAYFVVVSFENLWGRGFYTNKNLVSGIYYEGYLNNNQSVMKTGNNIYNNYSSSYYLSQDYWLGKDSFHINDDNTRYKYKAGRTYKWIAIWK